MQAARISPSRSRECSLSHLEQIDNRAQALAVQLSERGLEAAVVDGESTIGGGSAPGAVLPTGSSPLHRRNLSAARLESQLRSQPVPVIARIEGGRVVVDLRTVDPADDSRIAAAFGAGRSSA